MFSYIPTHTTVVIRGNDDKKPFGFKSIVTTKVLDTKSGAFYVGITNGPSGENKNSNTFAVSKANRPIFRSTQSFTGIAQDNLVDKTIEFLNLLPQDQAPSLLAVIPLNGTEKSSSRITILPTDGNKPVEHGEALRDARGDKNISTLGIVNIAATSTHVFATIRPGVGANNNFGDPNGGVALVAVNRKVDGSIEVTVKDAITGEDGNRALELQNNSAEITGSTNPVAFAAGDDINQVAMHFDEKLKLVYIGLRIATGANVGDKGKSVVIVRLNSDENNRVELRTIATDIAIAGDQQIIVAQGATIDLRAKLIRVLHASTGPSYLIVNGGTGTTDAISNKIFALPLVDSPKLMSHGTLANKNSNLFNGKFIISAALINDLPTQNDVAVKVGGGDLPIQAQTEVTDMVVVGDTVYASVGSTPDVNNDTGIFYSQALFDANGKIIRWTPWTKRSAPLNAFVGTNLPDDNNEDGIPHNGGISLFDIDAKTGNIWVVESTTGRVVGITSWTDKSTENRLITKLNEVLENGCFSTLDLDQATQGFSALNTQHRYALFGGANIVVFARISQAQGVAIINNPQTVITNFSDPQNLRVSNLPTDAGCAQALEYSKRNPGLPNFFFAGTQNGLFVFSNPNGTGFDVTTLATLDMPPFSSGIWQKISNITGSVIDIKTSGESLYVLTTETTDTQPFKSTLYNIPFQDNVTNMFANANIKTIAKTGEGIFTNVTAFFGIQIISTGNETMPAEVHEQLILATSNGLYKSNAVQAQAQKGIANANNQTDSAWKLIANSQNTLFVGIGGIETPVRHTVWPFSMQDVDRFKTFDRSSIHQISGSEDPTLINQATRADQPLIGTFNPLQFNAQNGENFATLDPITYFWSDGGRRFFIFNRIIDPTTQNRLGVIPFDVDTFNIAGPTILTHPILQKIQRFYWVQAIGTSGLVLAGTQKGVVGLE